VRAVADYHWSATGHAPVALAPVPELLQPLRPRPHCPRSLSQPWARACRGWLLSAA